MSVLSLFSWLWSHRPSRQTVEAVEAIAQAAKQFIDVLDKEIPEAEGKAEALASARDAEVKGNLALANAIRSSPSATGHDE